MSRDAYSRGRPEDIENIRMVNKEAFGQSVEANIINKLRQTTGSSEHDAMFYNS